MSQGNPSLFNLRTKLNLLILIGSSPLHKKQRLSSPIYPGFIEDLSPEDLQNLSEIDAAVSQNEYAMPPLQLSNPAVHHVEPLKLSQPTGDKRRASELGSEANNDLVTTPALATSVQLTSDAGTQPGPSVSATVGFASARTMAANGGNRSPSPEGPHPERDYDSWFNTSSTEVPDFVGFQPVPAANGTDFLGFTSVGKGTSFLPSEDAIEKVKKRMRDWDADIEEELSSMRPPTSQSKVTSPRQPVTPPRPSPGNPTSSRPISPQNSIFTGSTKQKPFKPPLLSNKTNLTNPVPASPSIHIQSKGSVPQFKPPLLSSTLASTLHKPSTPSRATADSAFHTPVRLGGAQRPGSVKKFTTPFKLGMRPGEPGRAKLQEDQEMKRLHERQTDQVFQIQMPSPPRKPVYDIPPSLRSPAGSRKGKEKAKAKEYRFFDLS
jgi:breast cancer 2 susceptibility protein